MQAQRWDRRVTIGFLLAEPVLYYFILTSGGMTAVVTSYLSICLCFLYGLLHRKSAPLMAAALGCTLAADFFLLVCRPQRQLLGMVCFLGTQSLYALDLHRKNPKKSMFFVRFGLIAIGEVLVFAVLGPKADLLAVISLCYYANLLTNIIAAWVLPGRNKLLTVGFILFLLCDTVIGLQVASQGYLPIPENTLLHRLLFPGFNLAWAFYLPSQVCLALSLYKRNDP